MYICVKSFTSAFLGEIAFNKLYRKSYPYLIKIDVILIDSQVHAKMPELFVCVLPPFNYYKMHNIIFVCTEK
jgi:hypothetical protein